MFVVFSPHFRMMVFCRISSSYDLFNNYHLKERPPLLGNLSLAASAQDLYRWYVILKFFDIFIEILSISVIF